MKQKEGGGEKSEGKGVDLHFVLLKNNNNNCKQSREEGVGTFFGKEEKLELSEAFAISSRKKNPALGKS